MGRAIVLPVGFNCLLPPVVIARVAPDTKAFGLVKNKMTGVSK